jgi:DNA modification methylase
MALDVAKQSREQGFDDLENAASIKSAYTMGLARMQKLVEEELQSRLNEASMQAELSKPVTPSEPGRLPMPASVIENPTWRAFLGHNLDVLRALPSESVDLVLTDPPYAIDLKTVRSMTRNLEKGKFIYEDKPAEILAAEALVMKECYRVLRPDRHCYVFFACVRWLEVYELLCAAGFDVSPIPLIWHKGEQTPIHPAYYYGTNYEPFFYCQKGRRSLSADHTAIFGPIGTPSGDRIHPTERPHEILRTLVELSTVPGETVLDPYAGSFSSVLAACETNRLGIGIEREPLYYSDAVARLKERYPLGREETHVKESANANGTV